MMTEQINELLPLSEKIAREFANIPGLPYTQIANAAQESLARNPKDRYPDAGKFLTALAK